MPQQSYETIANRLTKRITDITNSNAQNVTVSDIESIEKDFNAWVAITLPLAIVANDEKLQARCASILRKQKEELK